MNWESAAVTLAYEDAHTTAFALLEVVPITLAGMAALLRYSAEFDEKEDCWPSFPLLCDDKVGELPEENSREWSALEQLGRWHNWLQRHAADEPPKRRPRPFDI